jgi:hypothetical protein
MTRLRRILESVLQYLTLSNHFRQDISTTLVHLVNKVQYIGISVAVLPKLIKLLRLNVLAMIIFNSFLLKFQRDLCQKVLLLLPMTISTNLHTDMTYLDLQTDTWIHINSEGFGMKLWTLTSSDNSYKMKQVLVTSEIINHLITTGWSAVKSYCLASM